jgi:2,4-dienoyl-CoA reductase (NADPH2)
MKKSVYPNLFKPLKLNGLRLKNRITMAPLYLGYAAAGGKISPLLLYHYRIGARVVGGSAMAAKGAQRARPLNLKMQPQV